MEEQRRHVRVAPDPERPVGVSIHGWEGVGTFELIDISEGGLRLQAPKPIADLTVDAPVNLTLRLPDQPRLELRGVIRHKRGSSEPAFGVELQEATNRDLAVLRGYVEERARAGGAA